MPGAADAALDFVETKQGVVLVGQFAGAPAEGRIDGHDAAFALNPLDADAGGAFVDGGFERRNVVRPGRIRTPGISGSKSLRYFGWPVMESAPDAAAVEGVFERDDFDIYPDE